MSLEPEPSSPGPDAHRVLSPAELIDIKHAVERSLRAVPDLVLALSSRGDREHAMDDLAQVIGGLQVVHSELRLDEVDDDEPDDTVSQLERITRSGGRTDG